MMSLSQPSNEPKQASKYSGEIKDLLLAAQNQFFNDDNEVVRDKEDFEKLESFFDLVQKGSELNSDELSEIDAEQETLVSVQSLEDLSEGSESIAQDREVEKVISDIENEVLADGKISNPEADIFEAKTVDEKAISEDWQANVETGITEESFIADPLVTPSYLAADESQNVSDDISADDQLTAEYERGYAEAVSELEQSIIDEKQQLQNLRSVLFDVQSQFTEDLTQLMQEKIQQLAIDFIGEQIDADPEKLLEKIGNAVEKLSKHVGNLTVELNELDSLAIGGGQANGAADNIKFVSNENLSRGEFKLSDGLTSYSKIYAQGLE
jgi:hypothetical protein